MTFKTLLFSFTLVAGLSANAAVKNVCDDLVESKKSTDEQIQKCIAKFGESDTYKENIQKKKWQVDADLAKSAAVAASKANIESKKFTTSDLDDASFGKSFFAIRVDYSNQRKPKEKRITSGDALCSYLGFDKALKSIVSAEIMPDKANKNGLIIDTNFLGVIQKEPELYIDSDEKYTVRKYVEITCAKVKSKEVTGTSEELAKVAEDLIVLNETFNTPPKPKKEEKVMNDGSRQFPEGKTKNGAKLPEWAKDAPPPAEELER